MYDFRHCMYSMSMYWFVEEQQANKVIVYLPIESVAFNNLTTYIHGRGVCKAHLGTCLGEKKLGSSFRGTSRHSKKLNITCFRIQQF